MNDCEKYARWVLDPANEVKTGRLIKLAAQRFLNDLERDDLIFDLQCEERQEHEGAYFLVNFGEKYCRQWEGDWAGKPVLWEPWQKFVFMQVYGWKWKATGRRRFNQVFIQISKKNGKSTMSAVLANGHLFADKRVNTPKVFTAANNEDQAKIAVNMAGQIVKASPDLYEYIEDESVKLMTYGKDVIQVIHRERNGFIMALSKETDDAKSKTAGGKHGINASLGIVDEFGLSKDYGASGAIRTSMASRSERLMFFITTAGYNKEAPCFADLRDGGVKVLEGVNKNDGYLPIIFEIDQPKDENGKPGEITIDYLLEHPEVWQQSNPNMGVSVYEDFLRGELEEAKRKGGRTAVDCLTLNFNLWVDSPDTFIPADVWNKNAHGIEEEDLEGALCYGGIEFVSARMLNAFCLVFPEVKGKTVVKPLFWMPHDSLRDHDQFEKWVKEGFIQTDLGNVFENRKAVDLITSEIGKYNFQSFAFKNNLENSDIVQALLQAGYQGNPISHGIQGISTPTAAWEDLLTGFHVEHFGNPVLAWMNSNCTVKRKDNDVRLEKSGSKVVGIYAAINALAEMKTAMANPGNPMIEVWM